MNPSTTSSSAYGYSKPFKMRGQAHLLTAPTEVRNRILTILAADSRRWVPSSSLRNVVATTPASADHGSAQVFPWELAATCKQLYQEYIPILYANSTVMVYGVGNNPFTLAQALNPNVLPYIKKVCVIGKINVHLDYQRMPLLEVIEVISQDVYWAPSDATEVHFGFNAIAKNDGLVTFTRSHAEVYSALPNVVASPLVGQRIKLIVTVPVCVGLPSKNNYTVRMGQENTRDRDNQDVAFEFTYDHHTRIILTGTEQLNEAYKSLRDNLAGEEEHEAMLYRLNERRRMKKSDKEHLEYEIASWREREGDIVYLKDREWVFYGMEEK